MSAEMQQPSLPVAASASTSVSERSLASVEEHEALAGSPTAAAPPVRMRSTARSQTYPSLQHQQHHNNPHVVYPPVLATSSSTHFYPPSTHHPQPPLVLYPSHAASASAAPLVHPVDPSSLAIHQHHHQPPQHLPLYQEEWLSILTRLQHQVEFYFSLDNLMRDDYLVQQMLSNKGTVPCHVVGSFPRVVSIVGGVPASAHLLGRALHTSQVVRVYGTSLFPLTNALQVVLNTRNPSTKRQLQKQHSVNSTTTSLTDDASNSVSSSYVENEGLNPQDKVAVSSPKEENSQELTADSGSKSVSDTASNSHTANHLNVTTDAAPSSFSAPLEAGQAPNRHQVPYGYTVTTTGGAAAAAARPRYHPNMHNRHQHHHHHHPPPAPPQPLQHKNPPPQPTSQTHTEPSIQSQQQQAQPQLQPNENAPVPQHASTAKKKNARKKKNQSSSQPPPDASRQDAAPQHGTSKSKSGHQQQQASSQPPPKNNNHNKPSQGINHHHHGGGNKHYNHGHRHSKHPTGRGGRRSKEPSDSNLIKGMQAMSMKDEESAQQQEGAK